MGVVLFIPPVWCPLVSVNMYFFKTKKKGLGPNVILYPEKTSQFVIFGVQTCDGIRLHSQLI